MEFFIKDMNEISSIGAVEGKGRTRLSLSDTDAEARKWLLSKMRELELDVRIDRLGNMTGILPGENGTTDAPVTVGSHLDTVIEGGAFDGAYGIVGGLSVIRHLDLQCKCNECVR